MTRPQTWVEAFQIPPQNIRAWQSRLPAGEDLLRWCLLQGHVPENRYFPWAMKTFNLAKVKKEFFDIPADLVFWDRVKGLHDWSAHLVPLSEWEGTLMIGCVQPPEGFQVAMPHHFVLASALQLQNLWNKYRQSRQAAAEPVSSFEQPQEHVEESSMFDNEDSNPSFEVPEGLSVSLGALKSNDSETLSDEATHFDDDASPVEDVEAHEGDKSSSEEGESKELLEGLNFDSSKAAALDFSSLLAGTKSSPSSAAAGPSVSQVEAMSSSPSPHDSNAKTANLASKGPSMSESEMDHDGLLPELPPIPAPEFGVKPSAPPKAAPVSGVGVNKPASSELAGFVSQVTGANISVMSGVKKVPLSSVRSYDELAMQALVRVVELFQSGMILMFQNGQLRPWKWTDLLLSVHGDSPKSINIEEASIFRIVLRTNLPYHGYVVPNPVNDAFFNEFNRGKTPAHVTLTPMLIDRHIAGMVMGISDTEVDYKLSLSRMLQLSSEVSVELKRLREAKVA